MSGRCRCAQEAELSRPRQSRLYSQAKMPGEASFPVIFTCLCTYNWITDFLVSMRSGDTPVPIPNTMVKT